MKKAMLIFVLAAMVFAAGCWFNGYDHCSYYPNGKLKERYKFDYAKAMVTSNISEVTLLLPDGAYLKAKKVNLVYDGNDWEHVGNAIATGRAGGLNKLVK